MAALTFDASEDYYGILEIGVDSTKEDIIKAYRNVSKKYHPDKNIGKPDAADKFILAKKALDILTDDKLRSGYDAVIKARIAREKRNKSMDSKRKQMKQNLEEREAQYKKQREEEEEAKRKSQEEVEKWKEKRRKREEEDWKEWEEEMKRKKEQKEKQKSQQRKTDPTLKVSWDRTVSDYSQEQLESIFKLFGELDSIIVSSNQTNKKKGTALVLFVKPESAIFAVQQSPGNPNNRLKVSWASDNPPINANITPTSSTTSQKTATISLSEFEAFESSVLKRCMEAAQRTVQQQS